MRRIQCALAALFLGFWLHGVPQAEAIGIGEMFGFDPFRDHLTLETPHFRITHEAGHAEIARVAATHLEEAHRVLSPIMNWEPQYRTQVVIVDNSDFANGLAGAAGRLGMVLWTTPPDNWMSIAHYDDWFRMLCFHEYAHILNLDVTRDFYRVLRIFLGDSIRPNTLWQSWMLEGLATSQETTYTRAGRGRSSYYSMLRRGVWRAGMLEPVSQGGRGIGQIIGPRTVPPLGEVAYFFGHELMNEFAAGNPSQLGRLSNVAAGRLPFFYNREAGEVSGKDWREHWESWSAKARTRAEQEAKAIEDAGRTEPEFLSRGNLHSFRPALSPDGRWVAYGRERYDEQPILAIRDLKEKDRKKAERRLIENIGGGSAAFTANGEAVIFSSVEREGLYRFFSQLWVHEIASGKSYPLKLPKGVTSLRAKDPDVRGDRIVFTSTTTGRVGVSRARLVQADGKWGLESIERIYEPELFGRASTPRLSPDGRRIVFSLHKNAEVEERLVLIEENGDKSGRVIAAPSFGVLDRHPTWIDDETLVFSSNRSGVDNLYRLKLDVAKGGKAGAEPITNVESGVWFSTAASDGRILASVYTPTGWELAWFTPQKANPPQISTEPFFAPTAKEVTTPALTSSDLAANSWESKPYSVYPSLLPRAWSPLVMSSLSGGLSLTAALAGFDALDLHRYLLSGSYDTGLGAGEGMVEYSNRQLGAVWSLSGASKLQGIGETTFQREDSVGVSLSLFRPMTEAVWNPSLEWTWERVRLLSRDSARDSGETLRQVFSVPQVRAKVEFSDTDTSRQSILPEEGWMSTLGHQWSLARGGTTQELIWEQGHFFHLGNHAVLWPHWQLALSNAASVQLEGRRSQIVESFASTDFDQIVLRGYPLKVFSGLRNAGVGSLDFRFPIKRVEQGWSNRPVFFEVLQGLAFVETAALALPNQAAQRVSSWGLGVRGDWLVLNIIPLITALEYHQGFQTALGGKSELFFQFKFGGISF